MNKLLLKGKVVFLMLLTVACAIACDDENEDQPQLTVQTFMQQAAASDMFEINTGTMATTKGSMPDVKSFGQMLVADHTLSSTELITLAAQKNVTLSPTMPQDKTEKVMRLQGLTGTAFDKEFSAMQVQAHEEAINLYEKADNDITDANVQAFIDKTLPKLRMHLDHAQDLRDMTD